MMGIIEFFPSLFLFVALSPVLETQDSMAEKTILCLVYTLGSSLLNFASPTAGSYLMLDGLQ